MMPRWKVCNGNLGDLKKKNPCLTSFLRNVQFYIMVINGC